MNAQVLRLFQDLENEDPIDLADVVVRAVGDDRGLLAEAAAEWIRRYTGAPLPRALVPGPKATAVLRMLDALPASSERYGRLLSAARREAARSRFHARVLKIAIRLAPARADDAEWPAYVDACVREELAAGNGVAAHALELSDADPRLAYSLAKRQIEVLTEEALVPDLLRDHRRFARFGFREPLGEALETLFALALGRIGVAPTLPEDEELRTSLTPEAVLGSRMLCGIASDAIREGKPVPPAVTEAMKRAYEPIADAEWASALFLLSRSDRKHEVPKLIADAVDRSATPKGREAVLATVASAANGVFDGPGWGREPARKALVPLARTLLADARWPHHFWRAVFGESLFGIPRSENTSRSDDRVDKRSVEVMAWALLEVAADATEPLDRRRRALDAIGRSGVGDLGRALGKVTKDPAVGDNARAARVQLARTAKGHPVPPDIGIKLALACMKEGSR